MPINYKKQMDAELARIRETGRKPSLLLHACCAPCASAVLEILHPFFAITLWFHNPNITPEAEFLFRLSELKRLAQEMGLSEAKVLSPPYMPTEFETIARGMETVPEGGERCRRCYTLRLDSAAEYAAQSGFDYFTTTLSVSPHKNAQWLNEIGFSCEKDYGVRYLPADFKKGDGYKRSCRLSEAFGLYRQNYCGCIYAKRPDAEKVF